MAISADVFDTVTPAGYADMGPQIRNGDILLCYRTAGFSKLIQRATKCPWSHVGFIFKLDGIDRIMVLESVDGAGVRAQALSILVAGNGNRAKPHPGNLVVARHDDFASLDRFPEKSVRFSDQEAV